MFPLIIYGQTPQVKPMFNRVDKGGYFGLNVSASTIDSTISSSVGIRIMSITDRWFSYGLVLNGSFSSKVSKDTYTAKYFGGDGGFQINPILFPRHTVHISFPMTFGVGWLGEYEVTKNKNNFTGEELYYLYLQPGLELEFNMSHKIRMSFGASYTERFNIEGLSTMNPNISKLSLHFNLKFGNFGFFRRY